MKINQLPSKGELTLFNAQYYYNEDSGKGLSKHVIWVTYRAGNGRPLIAKYYLKSETKEINRMLKLQVKAGKLTQAESDAMQAHIKAEKQEHNVDIFFAYRMCEYNLPHKTVKTERYHKRTLDLNNCVFFRIREDGTVELQFVWAGEEIRTELTFQTARVGGQSTAYAYWTEGEVTEQELKDKLEEMKNGKQQGVIDAETKGHVCVPATGSDCDVGYEYIETTSLSPEDCESKAESSTERLARLTGIRVGSPSPVGNDDQESTADAYQARNEATPKRSRSRKDRNNDPFAGTAFDSNVLDQYAGSPFAEELVERDHSLGTTFRF